MAANVDVLRSTAEKVSNWGRWGPDDQRGTLNLITSDHIAAAAKLIRKGKAFSLGTPIHEKGPQEPGGIRINPLHFMTAIGRGSSHGPLRYSDDYIVMPLQASTQWDSLAHVYYDGKLYNGFASDTITEDGAARNSIAEVQPGVVGRGVLLDIARLRGVAYLEKGEGIAARELLECASKQNVQIGSGDILLVRTGWWGKYLEDHSTSEFKGGEPGLAFDTVELLRELDVAAVAADNYAVEVLPGEHDNEARLIVHMLLIRDMGMVLGEIFDLEALAEDCAADGVYEFFFCASPLIIPGAVGSPMTPIAVK
jgi:kynurenine formamidase